MKTSIQKITLNSKKSVEIDLHLSESSDFPFVLLIENFLLIPFELFLSFDWYWNWNSDEKWIKIFGKNLLFYELFRRCVSP